ncbi:MAG: hypothetical protein JW795_12490 [Chitinivibrionales bacterium]|nr:hypothetical protein [Chitinivibrionales bacterium]
MIILFLIVTFFGATLLIFHISLEVNKIEKRVGGLVSRVRKHYQLTAPQKPPQ